MVMAKRNYSKRSKIEPAVQTLYMVLPVTAGGASTTSYIDLSQVASIVNRRFYRQGINWAVGGFKIITPQPAGAQQFIGQVSISKLPNTWILANSWVKSFKAFQAMIRNATEQSGTKSIAGKFLDFKVFADADHHQAGFAANLLPRSVGGTATQGEWLPSRFELPDARSDLSTPQNVVAVGGNFPGISPATGNNAVSMIQGYADSRALPNIEDPNTPADASTNWMVRLFSSGSEQDEMVLDELERTGDQAPYPFEGDGTNLDTMYPGGETQLVGLQWHDLTSYGSTTISGSTRLKGGNFPCGLIRLDHVVAASSEAHSVGLLIDLIPGNHRGYLCETMMDM